MSFPRHKSLVKTAIPLTFDNRVRMFNSRLPRLLHRNSGFDCLEVGISFDTNYPAPYFWPHTPKRYVFNPL